MAAASVSSPQAQKMLAFLQPKPRDLRHSAGASAACWEAEALVLVLPQSPEGQGTCREGRQAGFSLHELHPKASNHDSSRRVRAGLLP